jgi:hypothetical protein
VTQRGKNIENKIIFKLERAFPDQKVLSLIFIEIPIYV